LWKAKRRKSRRSMFYGGAANLVAKTVVVWCAAWDEYRENVVLQLEAPAVDDNELQKLQAWQGP